MTVEPVSRGTITDFVPLFKALCNSTRAQIIEFLLGGHDIVDDSECGDEAVLLALRVTEGTRMRLDPVVRPV